MIKVYTIDGCPYCKEIKERLDEMELEYETIDVGLEENDAEFKKIVEITGSDYLPMVLVSNQMLVPEQSFQTIEECARHVKTILNS